MDDALLQDVFCQKTKKAPGKKVAPWRLLGACAPFSPWRLKVSTALVGTAWHLVVQGQYKDFMPVYIENSGDLVGCYRWFNSLTDRKLKIYRATQLVLSLKFKLNHATGNQ